MLSQESQRREILIAIEGPDYTGKSTIAKKLKDRIDSDYHRHRPAFNWDAPICEIFSRPGGTANCDTLREIVTNEKGISSITRQAIAFVEDVTFSNEFVSESPVVILDRFNPVSGQVYGPPEFRESWRFALERGIVLGVDRVIMIESTKETILGRMADRGKRDAMDDIFEAKIDRYLERYQSFKTDKWFLDNCRPCFIENNDDDLLGLVDRIYPFVREIIDERLDSIGT